MKRIFAIAALAAVLSVTSHAQEDGRFYCNLDVAAGTSFDRMPESNCRAVPETAIGLSMGWTFSHFITVAGTLEGVLTDPWSGKPAVSIPLSACLRSDFLDRPVSPYAELALGYSFMLPNGNERKRATVSYFSLSDGLEWYGSDGLFLRLAAGVSWKVGAHRMNLAVTGSCAQCYHGTWATEGFPARNVRYGHIVELPESGKQVVTRGNEPFWERFRLSCGMRLGFSF